MTAFTSYRVRLDTKVQEILSTPRILDLREKLNEELRNNGTFLTASDIAYTAISKFSKGISEDSVVLDPACGTGNLLVACSRELAVSRHSLKKTLRAWGKTLHGYDLCSDFIMTTKTRLVSEAINRGAYIDIQDLTEATSFFKGIIVKDALNETGFYSKATHILINPPYTKSKEHMDVPWGSGVLNIASVFISVILWRIAISSAINMEVDTIGLFDSKTDSVAIENHLIILEPVSGHLTDCRKLLHVLRSRETDQFLNERIRCRHLTVSSVKEIPWIL